MIRVCALLVLLFASPAYSQTNCGTRNEMIEQLEKKYGEQPAGAGQQNATSVFEVWYSPESGSWTILRSWATGRSCIMASGTHWQAYKIKKGEPL